MVDDHVQLKIYNHQVLPWYTPPFTSQWVPPYHHLTVPLPSYHRTAPTYHRTNTLHHRTVPHIIVPTHRTTVPYHRTVPSYHRTNTLHHRTVPPHHRTVPPYRTIYHRTNTPYVPNIAYTAWKSFTPTLAIHNIYSLHAGSDWTKHRKNVRTESQQPSINFAWSSSLSSPAWCQQTLDMIHHMGRMENSWGFNLLHSTAALYEGGNVLHGCYLHKYRQRMTAAEFTFWPWSFATV